MIKSFFIILWIIFDTIVMCLSAICVSFFSRNGNAPHFVAKYWSKSILWASGVKVHVKGLENLDPDKPCVFMCNHQSNFDVPVLLSALPAQFRWIAKAELFKIPLFGRAIKRAGYISINRQDRRLAVKSIGDAAKKIKSGVSVMIFPEGTRSPDGNIGTFKKGGFVLAQKAGVLIIPIVIHGTWPIMSKDSIKITPGKVNLSVLPPIDVTTYAKTDKGTLINDVREDVIKEFESFKLLEK